MTNSSTYETYVLRCYAEPGDQNDESAWRFVLINAASGDRRVFSSLGALVDELEMEFAPDDVDE